MKSKSTRRKSLELSKEFVLFNSTHHLISKNDKILLAVSGGMDSVALFHLLRLKGFNFSVAHCNFKLRGRHSEKDEKFVRELCAQYGIPFFSKSFDTESFSDENGISIQMAARDLRYAWFNQLMKEHSLDLLCTAHHLDDSIETVLLNLARGTGINGLAGIQAKSGKLVRPLIFATKKQITAFIRLHEFKFRKDKSNEEVKYKRNLIRKKKKVPD